MSTSDDRVAAAALATARVPDLLAQGSRAVLNGLWLGALSDDRLRAVDERYYASQPMYRTDEWNERGLFDWERELVDEAFPPGGRIVVVACGGGREVLALLEAGYDVVGYESHPALAAFGERFLAGHGHPSRIAAVPRDAFPADAPQCDGVIIGWGALSLMHGRDRRIALLRAARARVEQGTPMLVSFFERRRDHREARWTRGIANVIRRIRGARPLELGDTLAPNLVHLFLPDELAEEAGAAGFAVETHRVVGHIDAVWSYGAAVLRAR